MRWPADGPTGLYRIFGDNDVLLYIGAASQANLRARLRTHTRSALWRDEIRRNTVEWYGSRPEGEAAETEAIRTEKPRYNIAKSEWNEWNSRISTLPAWAGRPRGVALGVNGWPAKSPDGRVDQ